MLAAIPPFSFSFLFFLCSIVVYSVRRVYDATSSSICYEVAYIQLLEDLPKPLLAPKLAKTLECDALLSFPLSFEALADYIN
jgi:hypothetical protein